MKADKPERTKSESPTRSYAVEAIRINEINIGKQRIRADENDDGIIELASSMATRGLLQPIGVSKLSITSYQLLWGLRRLTAAKRLNWISIPARIYTTNKEPLEGLALIENIIRQDLSLEEESNAVVRLHEEENLSCGQICDLLGKGRAWVNTRLAIPNFPPRLATALLSERISLGAAESLASIEHEGMQDLALQQTIASGLTINEVRGLVEAVKRTPPITQAITAGVDAAPGGKNYQEVRLVCENCKMSRPVSQIRYVKICSEGCNQGPDGATVNQDAH